MKKLAVLPFRFLVMMLFVCFSFQSWGQNSYKLNLGASFGYASKLSYTEFNNQLKSGSGSIASVHAELKLKNVIIFGVHGSLLAHLTENTEFESWVESGFSGYTTFGYLSPGSHSRVQLGLLGIIGGSTIILDNTVWDGSLQVGLNPTIRYKIFDRISIMFDYRWLQGIRIAPRGGQLDAQSFNVGFSIGIF